MTIFSIGMWSMIRFAIFSLVRTRIARLRCDFKNAIDQSKTVNGMQIHFANREALNNQRALVTRRVLRVLGITLSTRWKQNFSFVYNRHRALVFCDFVCFKPSDHQCLSL
nr:hypothetical protein [Providencia rettgeri]